MKKSSEIIFNLSVKLKLTENIVFIVYNTIIKTKYIGLTMKCFYLIFHHNQESMGYF